VGRHQNQEVLEGFHSLEVLLEEGGCLLDDEGVWLLELVKDGGETICGQGL